MRVPIVDRNISLRAVEMSDGMRITFMISIVFVLPLLTAATGIVYFIKQKRTTF